MTDKRYQQQVTLLVTITDADGDPSVVGQGRLLPPAEWNWPELIDEDVIVLDCTPMKEVSDK